MGPPQLTKRDDTPAGRGTAYWRLVRRGTILILAVSPVAFLFAGVLNWIIWGYVFCPPQVPEAVDAMTTVTATFAFDVVPYARPLQIRKRVGPVKLKTDVASTPAEEVARYPDAHRPQLRGLRVLQGRALLPAQWAPATSLSDAELAGLLEDGEAAFGVRPSAIRFVDGIAILGQDGMGHELLALSVLDQSALTELTPFYEFAFVGSPGGHRWLPVSRKMFRDDLYDLFTWVNLRTLFLVCELLFMTVVLLGRGVVLLARRWRQHRAAQCRGFDVVV